MYNYKSNIELPAIKFLKILPQEWMLEYTYWSETIADNTKSIRLKSVAILKAANI